MSSNKMVWTGRILSALIAPLFAMSAVMKLIAHPKAVEGMGHLQLPAPLLFPLGVVELICLVLYLIPKTAVLGALLLTGYLGGAILTHLRLSEPILMPIGLGVVIWLGIYLREPRLRQVLPLRLAATSADK
ncbi:MAG TPA: DoxX family protein [bacterium]|nr:DoxX family protein [bacterium]